MYQSTTEFGNLVQQDSRTFKCLITYDKVSITTVKSIKFTGGSEGGDDFSLGSAMSQYVEVMVPDGNYLLEGKEILLQIGMAVNGKMEYIPVGYFTVGKPKKSDNQITFTAYDRMMKTERPFSMNGSDTNTVSVLKRVAEITGITVITTGLTAVSMKVPKGYSCREVLCYVAQLHGAFAVCNRKGQIELHTYKDSGYGVNPGRYWENFEHNEYTFDVSKLECYTGKDKDGNSISISAGSGARAVTFSNPFMTQAALNSVQASLQSFSYMPGKLKMLGDPRLDPWDILTVKDLAGKSYKVPIMKLEWEYDGGLTYSVEAVGLSEEETNSDYKGPQTIEMERYYAQLVMIDRAMINKLDVDTANITYATITNLDVVKEHVQEITGDLGKFKDLTATNFKATNAQIDILNGNYANIKTLISGGAGIGDLQNIHLTTENAVIDSALIRSAVIETVAISDLMAGTISTNKFTIASDDGGIRIQGATQQWSDADGIVRMQAGRDANGDFTFSLFDKTGKGVLIDSTGIKENAIADGLIVNKMVADNAGIAGSKLDIPSVVSEINGSTETIKSSRIWFDEEKQTLSQLYSDTKKTQDQTSQEVSSIKQGIEGFEMNLSALQNDVQANSINISIVQGKVDLLISESEIKKLQDEKVTMYSKMSDIKQTVDGLSEKYTSIKTEYDAVSKQYTDLDLKVAEYKKGVDSFSAELTKVKSNLENNYSTTVEMNTAITAKVGEITASVSKTYATKSSVDGIRVGGRNLVKNADRLDGKWSDSGTYISETKVVDDEYALSGKHIEVKCTKAGAGPNYPVFPKTLDKLNKTYTWSFYAKCSVEKSGNVGHECGGKTQIELTTAWKKFSYTWKYTDEEYSSFTFYLNFKAGEILYIRDFKIEEGTKATSWTLSPEDYSTTAEMNAAIKIRADAITSEVSKKVGASEIISKINQSAEKVSISASKINFNGLVTANNYFKVNTDGSIEAIKGKIGGWTIASNSLSSENISLNASYGAMKFSSNGKVVFTQSSRGSMYYTQYTDDRNYNALLFGRTGIKPISVEDDVEEIWLNDIEPDENWVLKFTNKKVTLNANVVNTDTAKMKNATFKGQIYFRDWENLNKSTPVYRHPIASATTDGSRIAYIESTLKNTTPALRVNAQWGGTGFTAMDFVLTAQVSDIRLKDNIRDSDIDALAIIEQMRVRQFDWKKGGHQNIGFIADELEKIDPNLAFGGGYDKNGEMNIKQVNTPYLINYVIKAIQELSDEIKDQKRRN